MGTFVAYGPAEFNRASLSPRGAALHGFSSWQMFEARVIIESSLAALAAEREGSTDAALAEEVAEMYAIADLAGIPQARRAVSPHHRPGLRQSDPGRGGRDHHLGDV